MLVAAGDVAFVLDFKCPYCTPDVEFGLNFPGIADTKVRKLLLGLIVGSRLILEGSKMHNVKLVSNVILLVERPILRMAKMKDDGMSAADGFRQSEGEIAGRISLRRCGGGISGGDDHASDGQLPSRIEILHDDGPVQDNGLLLLPANNREHCDGD